jgi:hypothetical protein
MLNEFDRVASRKKIYTSLDQCVAQHRRQPATQGWATVPDHHAGLWADTLAVERRPLAAYEEVATWS